MILGLDFDNTLIRYDELFHKVALEKGLIPPELAQEKNAVRDHLRVAGLEDEWTRMQGDVYGQRINEAPPYEGMLDTLLILTAQSIPIYIVSHKTKTPYLGQKHDLHASALGWLDKYHFFDPKGLNWNRNRVFFELTKQAKVARILDIGCTHYVDDLGEILEMLPKSIHKILFSPKSNPEVPDHWSRLRRWPDLPPLL